MYSVRECVFCLFVFVGFLLLRKIDFEFIRYTAKLIISFISQYMYNSPRMIIPAPSAV